MRKNLLVLWILALLVALSAGTAVAKAPENDVAAPEKSRVFTVNCDRGQTITRVLERRLLQIVVPLTIEFSGTCVEEVLINRDDVRLLGVGDNPTIQGSVTIEASSRVFLADFTVSQPTASGIAILRGSSAEVTAVQVLDTEFRGILLEESTAIVSHLTLTGGTPTSTVGILNRSSDLSVLGPVDASGFNVSGISATNGASYFIDNADIVLNNNANGAIFQLGSSVTFVGGSMTANNNGFAGLILGVQAELTYGEININADNNVIGIVVNIQSALTPFGGFPAEISASNNAATGVIVQETSVFQFTAGNLLVNNNPEGLRAFSAGSVTLAGGPTIDLSGNANGDLILQFGSRGRILGAPTIGNIVCDDTALIVGAMCPAPIQSLADDGLMKQMEFYLQAASAM